MRNFKIQEHIYNAKMFYLISFIITWTAGGIIAYQSRTGAEKSLLLLLLAYMGPVCAALITMMIKRDKTGFKDFRNRLFNVKIIEWKYMPVAVLLMPLCMLTAIAISTLFGQPSSQFGIAEELQIFSGELVLSMVILALVPVLEEIGWRGYGIDALRSRHNLFKTSLYFAFLWGCWHLPVFFIQGSYQASLWIMNPLYAINFFIGIIPLAFILNWLYYKNKRSILIASIFHVMVNYSSEIFQANQVSKCILTLVLIAVALVLIKRDKNYFFTN